MSVWPESVGGFVGRWAPSATIVLGEAARRFVATPRVVAAPVGAW
jgi:hypothetical protein